jgi:hypothetical protein
MTTQPGIGVPAPLDPTGEVENEQETTDDGVPVGAADVEADRKNAEERSESSTDDDDQTA